jgi:L-ornithine Nalpha-acyltransferase
LNIQNQMMKQGALKIRLAKSSAEVRVAQKLRYLVFHEELGIQLQAENQAAKIESDAFDKICDHLLVIREGSEHNSALAVDDGSVIGTYRLLRQSVALQNAGFYSQSEFDIGPLLTRQHGLKFLELGRSCVLKNERGSTVVELLWQGIWNYVRQHQVDVMIGCASFDGIDVDVHHEGLQFLLANNKVPEGWQVHAHPQRRLDIKPSANAQRDVRKIVSSLPPLIKGYLRLGCFFGQGAVVDEIFNTIDVLVILPVSHINPRYFTKFGEPTS